MRVRLHINEIQKQKPDYGLTRFRSPSYCNSLSPEYKIAFWRVYQIKILAREK